MQAADRPRVSVIIPARNEARNIDSCLGALEAQTYPQDRMEILVAVGPSLDETSKLVEEAAKRNPRISMLSAPSGATPEALNLAIAAAGGEIICRMDAHAIPAADYIEKCVDVLESSKAWCVGGRMNKVGSSAMQEAIAQAMSARFGIGDSSFHYAGRPQAVDSVYLGCWPRWVFDVVGGFDDELLRNQDDELSFRIRQAGGLIWFDPSIQVQYQPRDSLTGVFDQHRQYGLWKIRVFQKHPQAARWRHFAPPALVAVLGMAAFVPVSQLARRTVVGVAVTYIACAAYSAVRIHRRQSRARTLDVMGAFIAMHLGYGVGMWQGLFKLARRKTNAQAASGD